jgi:hypothetical protein
MPMFFGVILGGLLTVLTAYVCDSASGRVGNGMAAANGQAPMVNWEVVGSDWQVLKEHVHATAAGVEHKLKERAG